MGLKKLGSSFVTNMGSAGTNIADGAKYLKNSISEALSPTKVNVAYLNKVKPAKSTRDAYSEKALTEDQEDYLDELASKLASNISTAFSTLQSGQREPKKNKGTVQIPSSLVEEGVPIHVEKENDYQLAKFLAAIVRETNFSDDEYMEDVKQQLEKHPDLKDLPQTKVILDATNYTSFEQAFTEAKAKKEKPVITTATTPTFTSPVRVMLAEFEQFTSENKITERNLLIDQMAKDNLRTPKEIKNAPDEKTKFEYRTHNRLVKTAKRIKKEMSKTTNFEKILAEENQKELGKIYKAFDKRVKGFKKFAEQLTRQSDLLESVQQMRSHLKGKKVQQWHRSDYKELKKSATPNMASAKRDVSKVVDNLYNMKKVYKKARPHVLGANIEKSNEEVKALQKQNEAIQRGIERLNSQLKKVVAERDSITTKIANFENQIIENSTKISDYEKNNNNLSNEIKSLNSEINQEEIQLNELKNNINFKPKPLALTANPHKNIALLTKRIKAVQGAMDKAQSNKKTAGSAFLKSRMGTETETKEEKKKFQQFNNNYNFLKQQLSILEKKKEIEEKKEEKSKNTSEITRLTDENTAINRDDIPPLKADLEKLNKDASSEATDKGLAYQIAKEKEKIIDNKSKIQGLKQTQEKKVQEKQLYKTDSSIGKVADFAKKTIKRSV